jgi:hypothetical protein
MAHRFILALALTASASATQTPPPDEQVITVDGRRTTREEIRREAEEFVRTTGIATSNKPAARWVDAVCPTVKGVSEANAATVIAKIEAVAVAAGAPVARKPCKPNIVVAFAADGSALTGTIAKDRRKIGGVPVREREQLIEADVPLRWWYATDTRGRQGARKTTGQLPWAGSDAGGTQEGGGSPTNDATTIVQTTSSIVSTQVNRVLTNATVIVDATLAKSQPLDAIAAHIAMVALAEIDRDAKPTGSILALFSTPSSGLDDLGDGDRALLKSLYGIKLDRAGWQQRGTLVDGMIRARTEGAKGY